MSQSGRHSISALCDYLGISRQGYYTHVSKKMETDVLKTSLILYCKAVRADQLPKAGMRQLYEMCRRRFGEKMTIGRDQFFNLLRANDMTLRRKCKPKTTNSNHNYYIYPDLLNTTPKLVAARFCQLVVGDITYVATASGWAYLSLLTDAATRLIVGWALLPTLGKEGPMEALEMAKRFYMDNGIVFSKNTDERIQLIHHSDRGSQYCSNEYVKMLKDSGIRISMTQTGDPLHNALAERMNNTIKNGWLFDCDNLTFDEAKAQIAHAVDMYNNVRPHQALGMKTPMEQLHALEKAA